MNFNNFVLLTPHILQTPNLHPTNYSISPWPQSYFVFTRFSAPTHQKVQPTAYQPNHAANIEMMAHTRQSLMMTPISFGVGINKQRVEGELNSQKANNGLTSAQINAEMGCQCRMSRCSKYYCFCFKNGKGCSDKCACRNCKNTRDRHGSKKWLKKRKLTICNCVRTECQKKYCECYANGKKCGQGCKCKNCLN